MKYDIIVIGSGLGGLVCAQVLSEAGMRVLVLEKGRQAGGCLQSYRRGGMAFDTGFHYVGGLGEGQLLHAVFKLLGLSGLPWKRLDPFFDRVMLGGWAFAFAQGYGAFVEALCRDFPRERKALEEYARLLKHTEEHQADVLNPEYRGSSPSSLWETGAWQYLADTFHDALLVNVLSATSLKMELRRESLPLFTFLHGNSSFIESSWRLQGDSSLIVNALLGNIRKQGGEIICGAEVEELVETEGRVAAARCANGEVYEAEAFISDVHPAVTCGWFKQGRLLKGVYRRRLGALENTFGMLTVSLALKPQVLPYFNWNQYIYPQADVWACHEKGEPLGGMLICCRAPEGNGKYTRQVDLLTPMSWGRCAVWSQTRTGRRGEAYREMKERLADACVALAEQVIPGLRGMVESRYVSTPLTYRDYTFAPDGSAYGIRKDYRNPLMTAISPRTPVSNLFLTGQNLLLHGIQGVAMTALFTCAELLGKAYIWNKLKQQ